MMISTKGRYALRVMVELASHDVDKYIPLREIAKNQDISEKYLESIIKVLVQHNLVIGIRGKGGGYKLSYNPAKYTVGEILRLTEGSLAPVACLKDETNHCERSANCLTLPMWEELNRIVNEYLDSITLEDLVKQSIDRNCGDYII